MLGKRAARMERHPFPDDQPLRMPVLTIPMDWSWHSWDHLFGTYTYRGLPVYGFHSTSTGQPLDSFGRNLYVDTLD